MSSPSISAFTAGSSFRAATQARTKKDMKPRRTPLCFFSKASLYSERSAIAADMSTSLKVVSISAVFWASFRREAMVLRRRVILTRSSPSSSARGAFGAAGAAAGAAAGRARKSSTSPLVTRPSLPVPVERAAAGTLLSAIILAAAGSGACGASLGTDAGRATGPVAVGGGFTPAAGLAAG